MSGKDSPRIAILLATYNGAPFIEPQLESLKNNVARFTIHWLDDHSTDDTRQVVRASAARLGLELREWHQQQHEGLPGSFFRLLECVDADIYLFCDQDDIWEKGKIDATVEALISNLSAPVLCFSLLSIFFNDNPNAPRSRASAESVIPFLAESKSFMLCQSVGSTQGFTRPLREIFLTHKEIAKAHACGHDWWMHLIALATGTVKMLPTAPTTQHRRHSSNATTYYWVKRVDKVWKLQQTLRARQAHQAKGFLLASSALPAGPKLSKMIHFAQIVSSLSRRQSLSAVFSMTRKGILWSPNGTLWMAAACFLVEAS
jgi:glycosyltransferase involved in cell wall biosynthesis